MRRPRLEQVDTTGKALYYYQDQLGSTRGLLDGSASTVATFTYDPYGVLVGSTGTATTPFGYAGQYTDSESGLQYLRNRYYDPRSEQFLTVDPLQSVTMRPYGYAGDDPLNAVDPTGLASMAPSGGACGCVKQDPGGGIMSWMAKNWQYVALVAGLAAIVAVLGGPEVAFTVGAASLVASAVQVYIDLQKGDSYAAALDLIGFVASIAGLALGWRALQYAWKLHDILGPLKDALASGHLVRAVMLLTGAVSVAKLKALAEARALRLGVWSVMAGIWAAVGVGGPEAACI